MACLHVVIVSFNARDLVLSCIRSLLECDQEVHLHISDNASTDGTPEVILADYAGRPDITLYKNGENLGFARASNVPLAHLRGDYVLFLNPDAKVSRASLSTMLDFMSGNPDVGMAGPLIVNEDGTEQRGCRRREPTPARAFSTFFPFKASSVSVNMVNELNPGVPIEVDAISGAFMLVRRRALEEVGPMDEGYFLHCEDLDWCKRFRLKGWRVMFVPSVTISHFKGGSSLSRPVRVEWHKHKGMVRYYHKFYRNQYPGSLMWLVNLAIWGRFMVLAPLLVLKKWTK